jgi:HEAT repeat protein
MRARALVVVAAAAACAGCPSGGRRPDPTPPTVAAGEGDRPYYAGTEEERRRLEEMAAALATARDEKAVEVGRRILSRGEAAIPVLLDALKGASPAQRGAAAFLLGVAKDRRTLPALVEAVADPVPSVRYEAAGALLELGDARGLDVLVGGLEDADARLRAKCLEVLKEKTGLSFGFEADGPPDERAAAVRRWRAWLAARAGPSRPEGDGSAR